MFSKGLLASFFVLLLTANAVLGDEWDKVPETVRAFCKKCPKSRYAYCNVTDETNPKCITGTCSPCRECGCRGFCVWWSRSKCICIDKQ
ncbi:hypothetical protein Ddc_14892 [Ditylenchus destructor]|nr:hypothetical protein Ddc_14892 [Ditylenchus destructor]